VTEGGDKPVGFCSIKYSSARLGCSGGVGVERGTPFDVIDLRRVMREIARYDGVLAA
jgi:hypothetical protein